MNRKLGTIGVIALLLMAMTSIASAETLTLELTTKDPVTWEATDSGAVTLTYNSAGATFDYSVVGTVPSSNTQYALIYYADKPDRFVSWGGDNPGAVIGTGMSDGSGNINFAGSKELNINLPHPNDANFDTTETDYCYVDEYENCYGAKLWLVPTSALTNEDSLPLVSWAPTEYLFETDLIRYTYRALATNNVMATGNIQVGVCPVGVVGLSINENNLNFGAILPGETGTDVITVTASANGYDPRICNNYEDAPETVDVGIALSDWSYSTYIMSSEVTSVDGLPATLEVDQLYDVTFDVTPPIGTIAGAYTQTITISAIY